MAAPGLVGADVGQLRRLAQEFDQAAQDLDRARSQVGSRVQSQYWIGPSAQRFRSSWDTGHSARLRTAALEIRSAAQRLRLNADDQERTSRDGTGRSSSDPIRPGGGAGDSGGSESGHSGGREGTPEPDEGSGKTVFGSNHPRGGDPTDTAWSDKQPDLDWVSDQGWAHQSGRDFEWTRQPDAVAGGYTPWSPNHDPDWTESDNRDVDPATATSTTDRVAEATEVTWAEGGTSGTHGAEFQVAGTHTIGKDVTAETEASGWAGLHGEAGWDVKSDSSHLLVAGGSAMIGAGAGVAGSASINYGVLSGKASGEAMAGAYAQGQGSVSVGSDGVSAKLGGSAFAGAEAKGDVGVNVGGVEAKVGGSVYAGVGVHANVDATFSSNKVAVSLDVGAALGVGAGFSIKIDINPSEIVENLTSWWPF